MVQYKPFRGPLFRKVPDDLAQVLRPRPYLTDVKYETGVLYEPEIALLMDIVLLVLSCLPQVPTKGALIIDGKKSNEDAQCIMRAQLNASAGTQGMERAEEAIDGILDNLQLPRGGGTIHSYCDSKHPSVLILGATHGHFLVTINLVDAPQIMPDYDYEELTLLAVAVALGQMGKEDTMLQRAVTELKESYERRQTGGKSIHCRWIRAVEQLFASKKNPVIQNWRRWHESANQSGALQLFFE